MSVAQVGQFMVSKFYTTKDAIICKSSIFHKTHDLVITITISYSSVTTVSLSLTNSHAKNTCVSFQPVLIQHDSLF